MKFHPTASIIFAHLLLSAGGLYAQQAAATGTTSQAGESSNPAGSSKKSNPKAADPQATSETTTATQKLEDVTVTASTASGVLENVATIPQAINLVDSTQIAEDKGRNLADVLNKNSLSYTGYTGGVDHAPVQLRGASSGGATQNWDNLSEVGILVNGRPSGTGNVAKLLNYDLERLEILRGPASVIYGSQAMGGVINLITKDGLTFQGTRITASVGTWDEYTVSLEHGGKDGKLDWYVDVAGQTRSDYHSGEGSRGRMFNTGYKNGLLDLNLGYDINDLNRVNVIARTGGFFHADHNGVTFSLTDYDNRYGTSVDIIYNGRTADGTLSWTNHPYFVEDVDELVWSQDPLIGSQLAVVSKYLPKTGATASYWKNYQLNNNYWSGTLKSVAGITKDDNTRTEDKFGDIFELTWKPIDSNKLLVGVSLDYTQVRSTREREAANPDQYNAIWNYIYNNPSNPVLNYPGLAKNWTKVNILPLNLAPLEYNYDSYTGAIFAEDSQKLLDDKLDVRLGGRVDYIAQQIVDTPFEDEGTNKNLKTDISPTWRTGATYAANQWLTLRASTGTGFLAAPVTALYSTTAQANGSIRIGNPDLKNETNVGGEVGANAALGALNVDLDYFFNQIYNRITSLSIDPNVANAPTRWANLNEVDVQGIEFKISYDIAQLAKWNGYKLEPYATGLYNTALDVRDSFVNYPYNNHQLTGVPLYQATVGLRGGKLGKWSLDAYGVATGNQWGTTTNAYYSTSNTSLAYPSGYSKKGPAYWTFNVRGNYELTKNLSLFAGINNILNLNYDGGMSYTLNDFISTYKPSTAGPNGGTGMSLAGRQFFAGASYTF
ncbi:MAG: TonB-dependent receptor [Chthoniobacteraceae bacterium]